MKDIIDYFDDRHAEDTGLRFLNALDDTIKFVEEFPDLGSPWESDNPRQAGIRFRLIKGFENYLLL
ncbi:MAG TPA: hypothetical protein VE988_23720 [Gemmataceae bacterium]|nr:hypothetical protein [Gemmataceae bacterium]